MEISSVYAISSVASALASSPAGGAVGNWLYSKFKKWSLKKRLSGLLLLKGVSTLSQKLSNNEVVIQHVGERELLKDCSEARKDIEAQVVNRYSYIFIIDKK